MLDDNIVLPPGTAVAGDPDSDPDPGTKAKKRRRDLDTEDLTAERRRVQELLR